MHLSLAVHRHPRPGDHPDRPEPDGLTLGGSTDRATELVARNVTRDTLLASRTEVAGGLLGKFMGLMGRATLAPDAALWLPDSNGIHMMFMRFPIDAIFVGREDPARDGARPVLSVHRGLRAWVGLVPLVRGAHGVLELPVGAIDASGTAVGDLVRLARETAAPD